MDKLPTSFGLTIAFLFPGVVVLAAVSFFVPLVQGWLVGNNAGGAILALLVAAGAGAFVSHVRSLVDDELLGRHPDSRTLNHQAREAEGKEAAYQTLVLNHYNYYLFGTNTTVAGWILFVAWWWAHRPTWAAFFSAFGCGMVASYILVRTGYRARRLFHDKAVQLLGTVPRKAA